VRRVHKRILAAVAGVTSFTAWLEQADLFGVDVDVVPLQLLLKKSASKMKSERKKMMEEEEAEELEGKSKKKQALAEAEGEDPKSPKKKCRPAAVYAFFSTAVAIIAWVAVDVLSTLYILGYIDLSVAAPPPPPEGFHLG